VRPPRVTAAHGEMFVKRIMAAMFAAILTFGLVYGLAASLNLTTDSLGAATNTVAACQAGAMNATYSSSYSTSLPGYSVGTVTVTGLASTCYSKPYKITLAGAASVGPPSTSAPPSRNPETRTAARPAGRAAG